MRKENKQKYLKFCKHDLSGISLWGLASSRAVLTVCVLTAGPPDVPFGGREQTGGWAFQSVI